MIMAHAKLSPKEEAILTHIYTFIPMARIGVNELRNPTNIIVSCFYNECLDQLGVDSGNLNKMQGSQVTAIAYADMYGEAISMMNVYHGIKYFSQHIGISDFRLTDLTHPTYQRTLSHFYTWMQFLAYCDEKISELDPELGKLNKLQQARNELQSNIVVLRTAINKNATERVKRADVIDKLLKLIDKDKEEMEQLMKERETEGVAVNSIKKLVEEDGVKEQDLIQIINQIQDEMEMLNSMVVTSPDKLQASLDNLRKEKENYSKDLQNYKSQVEEKQKLKNELLKKQKEQEVTREKLMKLIMLKNALNEKSKEKAKLGDDINKLFEEKENRKKLIEKLEQNQELQEAMKQLKNLKIKQETEKTEKIKKAEEELDAIVASQKQKKEYKNYLQLQINKVHEEMDNLKKECLKFREGYLRKNDELSVAQRNLIEKFEGLLQKTRLHTSNI